MPFLILLLLLTLSVSSHATQPDPLATLTPGHPHLLVSDSTWHDLQARRRQSPTLDRLLTKLELSGRASLSDPPLTYLKTGRRLLAISRAALQRIVLWSFDYRLTGDPKFRDRAEQEMLTVSRFHDWDPSHFLDVAEMTAAVSLGYDWLYSDLPAAARAEIRQAIVEKGLKAGDDPKLPFTSWYKSEMNWNQVCFGGLTLGALAVADEEPAVARQMLEQVRTYNLNGMKPYAPAGVYPEGPNYWIYGTTYEVMLIAALESALGTDWNISQAPGFLATADYPLHVTGPTGLFFNYSDCGERGHLAPALFWFARKLNKPDVVYYQYTYLKEYLNDPRAKASGESEITPLLAVWAGDLDHPAAPNRPLDWYGDGPNPLAVFRSSWTDPNALFLALKGGSASLNHAHMDAGSFVMDADGVRWAKDLGMQDYYSLESKHIDLWNNKQTGGRWSVFRLNNFSHNTLTINGQLHQVKGHAEIIRFSGDSAAPDVPPHAVVDLSSIFAGQASKVIRGFKILPNREVLIQDELSGLKPGDVVRWAFVTPAHAVVNGNRATLTQKGKQLQIAMTSPANGSFQVIPADPPPDGYDAPNPNTSILIANLRAPAAGQLLIQTCLQPGPAIPAAPQTIPCETWSAAK